MSEKLILVNLEAFKYGCKIEFLNDRKGYLRINP